MTLSGLDDQIGLRARRKQVKFQLLGKLQIGLSWKAHQLRKKVVALFFGNRQRALRAQQGNPAKGTVVVKTRNPTVPEHQTTGEE